jgi:hypothetical protein
MNRDFNIMENLSDEDRLIVYCVRQERSADLDKEIADILKGSVDWQKLITQSGLHGVDAFVYKTLKEVDADVVPAKVMEILRSSYLSVNAKGMTLSEELTRILREFGKNEIECMPIKGAFLDEVVYQHSGMRGYTDIDILVQPPDISDAATLIESLGYKATPEDDVLAKKDGRTQHHFVNKNGSVVDLHWELVNNRWYPGLAQFFKDNAWSRAISIQFAHRRIRSMSPEVLLIYQCSHAAVHHNFSRLILLKDIEQTLRYEPSLDWDSVVELARQYRMMTICYYSLRFSKDLLDASVPEWVLDDLHPGFFSARLFNRLVKREGIMMMASDRRAWAQQTWMILRDDYVDRMRAIKWRLFPSVAWFLRFYPFLPRLPEVFYYPMYPLLLFLRLIRRPDDQINLRRRTTNGAG